MTASARPLPRRARQHQTDAMTTNNFIDTEALSRSVPDPARVAMLTEAVRQGDPLAEAVIAELDALGAAARDKLAHALRHGLDAVDAPPPAIAAFVRALEQVPPGIDTALVAAGDRASISIPPFWHSIALALASLLPNHTNIRVAKVLANTGNLAYAAGRRLAETATWRIHATSPGGLARGQAGYIGTIQVRLLHARVRTALLRRGWDVRADGVPINRADTLNTWLDFTVVPFSALQRLGIDLSADEEAALYRYWGYVGHLLGIDPDWCAQITSHKQGAAWREASLATQQIGLDDNVRAIQGALVDTVAERLAALMPNGPASVARELVFALARRVLGDAACDAMECEPSTLGGVVDMFVAQNAASRREYRESQQTWGRYLERNSEQYLQMAAHLQGPTTYQKSLADPPAAGTTPVTAA